jgi:hypothetical protein
MRTLLGVLGLFVVGLLVDQGLAWVSSTKGGGAAKPAPAVDTPAERSAPIAPPRREVAVRRQDVSPIRP